MSLAHSKHQFWHQGQLVYEWEQTLDEVSLSIQVPEGVKAKDLYVELSTRHLRLGILNNAPYISEDLGGPIAISDSFWTIEKGKLQLLLTKAHKCEVWTAALKGHTLSSAAQEGDKKQLLLERFQEEHPGFNFSGAEISGTTPDPRSFLDGMSAQRTAVIKQQRLEQLRQHIGFKTKPLSTGLNAHSSLTEQFEADSKQQPAAAHIISGTADVSLNDVRIVGIGRRGGSIASRIVSRVPGIQAWYVETESNNLDATGVRKVVVEGREGMQGLSESELNKVLDMHPLKGQQDSRRMSIAKKAFIVGAAGGVPGGADAIVALSVAFWRAGFHVTAALAIPFEFEGPRKMQSAMSLVEKMRASTHTIAAIEQELLAAVTTNADGVPMTVSEATIIADNAMEQSIKCMLAAFAAPAALLSCQGRPLMLDSEVTEGKALMDPSHFLQSLEEPGTAALGRGAATMAASLQHAIGRQQAVACLIEDAVRAAADSPFLEPVKHEAKMIICSIAIASGVSFWEPGDTFVESEAAHSMQAAFHVLKDVCPDAEAFVCYDTFRQEDASRQETTVEISLLMFHSEGVGHHRQTILRNKSSGRESRTFDSQNISLPDDDNSGHVHDKGRTRRLPASSWSALSAIASGSANGVGSNSPYTSGASRKPAEQPISEATAKSRSSQVKTDTAILPQAYGVGSTSKSVLSKGGQRVMSNQDTVESALADSLIAHSLDLPPKAAKWRQTQRLKIERPRIIGDPSKRSWEEEDADEEGLQASLRSFINGSQKKVHVRERMFAILERDRGDEWHQNHSRT